MICGHTLRLFLIIVALLVPQFVGAQTVVTYPNIDGIGKDSIGFKVLELALAKSKKPFTLQVGSSTVNQNRARGELENGNLSVIDTGVEASLEARFDPVYLPIDRGVLGWRLFIINKDLEAEFAKVKTIEDLRKKVAGQGQGWGDIAILEHAGLQVMTSPTIENLMLMVQGKRFDFFPLGANEVFGFLDKYGKGSSSTVVEKNVVLVYPYARFFYVKKGDKALHAAISEGMEAALADGSLQQLLKTHSMFKDAFTTANLKARTVIRIDSPGMPEGFKRIDKKWWFDPTK